MQRSALLAVPLLLGAVDGREVPSWFEAVAGEGFTTPWGVRLLATDDPLFDPRGILCGTVWPLYTGWVSLAEWRAGRWEAALAHLKSNASLAGERAKGAFDESLHGLERAGTGCPDQACSAAMVISPVIEGLWGAVPDALNQTVQVSPYLPQGWNEMALRRLRVGPTTLDLRLRRRPGRLRLGVARVHGPRIRFAATVRSQAPVDHITLDDEPLGASRAVFEASAEHELEFGLREP
jgi:glycogen debranching enzyme